MFRLHARSTDPEDLRDFAAEVAFKVAERPGSTPLVHLFNDTSDREVSQRAVEALRSVMPNCLIAGNSTSGNICSGAFTNNPLPNLTAFCDIYEDPTTRVEVIQVDLDEQTRRASTRNILESLSTRPWVRAVEMLTTIIDVDMHAFCTDLNRANPDVVFFGGGALSRETINMFLGLPYVFSSAGDASGHAVVMVLYGGPNFHVTTEAVIGWRTLGRHLEVTKAEGPIVYELDHRPAYELYHHYLSIENDEQFDRNSLIFPLVFDHNGHDVVKAPVRVGEGGSLVLTSSVGADDRSCRLAYGDPAIILKTIKRCTRTISEFFPDAILSFSCAGRFTYWGEDFISRETLPFQAIAPTDGFYTGSEFGRWNGPMLQHNLTLVLAAIREGDRPDEVPVQAPVDDAEFDRQMAIVSKLAAFVGVTSTDTRRAMRYSWVWARSCASWWTRRASGNRHGGAARSSWRSLPAAPSRTRARSQTPSACGSAGRTSCTRDSTP